MALTVFAPPRGTIISINCLRSALCKFDNYVEGERKKVKLLLVLFLCLSDPQLAPLFQFAKQRQRIVGSGKWKSMGKVAKENVCLSKRKDRGRETWREQRKRMFVKLQVCVCEFVFLIESISRTHTSAREVSSRRQIRKAVEKCEKTFRRREKHRTSFSVSVLFDIIEDLQFNA